MRNVLGLVLATLLVTHPLGLCDEASVSGSPLTASEIYANMFNLEHKIVKIRFPSDNPKQISPEFFSVNYGAENQVAVVLLPAEVGRKYFREKSRQSFPSHLYVEVQVGDITNQYGATQRGPVLVGQGTKIHRGLDGGTTFLW